MERKVILYISMSLDGYIADSAGGVDWLGGHDPAYEGDYGYAAFFQTVGTILMGWNTYHQVVTDLSPDVWPYAGKETYVLTHRQLQKRDGVTFVNMPAPQLIRDLKAREGGDIWICGGADLVRQLMAEEAIDELHLSVMPCLLGEGVRLFSPGQTQRLELLSVREENGVLDCVYRRI